MTLTVDTSQMKAQLSEFIGRVAFGHERLLVLRRGKPVAALVPVEDLRQLEVADAAARESQTTSLMHPIMRAYGGDPTNGAIATLGPGATGGIWQPRRGGQRPERSADLWHRRLRRASLWPCPVWAGAG